jgi:hypothetical protein
MDEEHALITRGPNTQGKRLPAGRPAPVDKPIWRRNDAAGPATLHRQTKAKSGTACDDLLSPAQRTSILAATQGPARYASRVGRPDSSRPSARSANRSAHCIP